MQINPINSKNNTDIQKTVKSDKTSSKSSFSDVLNSTISKSKTTDLDQIFDKASEKYNISVNLLKVVAKAESNFNPKAKSGCGAMGVMQLMPGTAKGLGVTDPYDAEQNIMGGAKYLSRMIKKYDGDVSLALAAYNAGSGNVAKYGGIPPFKETQNYVAKIMKSCGEELTAGTVSYSGSVDSGSSALTGLSGLLQNSDLFTLSVEDGFMDEIDFDLMLEMCQYELQSKFLYNSSEKRD